jgi:hypothetical protein
MKSIKLFFLICYIFLFNYGCTTFNISATDNNVLVDARDGLNFETIIKKKIILNFFIMIKMIGKYMM